jgi:methylated-DNA-protein-cysteine methyltransferase-like protein
VTPYARRVLDVVDAIPAGRVLTYGDIAELLGSGAARAVGMVLARYGSDVPWHRVVLSTGAPAPGHEEVAVRLLLAEGVPLRDGRVDLPSARWVDADLPAG